MRDGRPFVDSGDGRNGGRRKNLNMSPLNWRQKLLREEHSSPPPLIQILFRDPTPNFISSLFISRSDMNEV